MVDTAISEGFFRDYKFTFSYLDFTNDASLFTEVKGSHAEILLTHLKKRCDLTLLKVYKNNGEIEIPFIQRTLQHIYRSHYDIVLFAMAIHVINPQILYDLTETTILINQIMNKNIEFVAAVSNLVFL